MSYDDKLATLASTLPVAFSCTEEANRVAMAHKHPDANSWVEQVAKSLYETREKLGADFNSALDAIGDQQHRLESVMLSALRDAIRILARQRVTANQLQPV